MPDMLFHIVSLSFSALFSFPLSPLSIIPRDSSDVYNTYCTHFTKSSVFFFFPIISSLSFQTYDDRRRPLLGACCRLRSLALLNSMSAELLPTNTLTCILSNIKIAQFVWLTKKISGSVGNQKQWSRTSYMTGLSSL